MYITKDWVSRKVTDLPYAVLDFAEYPLTWSKEGDAKYSKKAPKKTAKKDEWTPDASPVVDPDADNAPVDGEWTPDAELTADDLAELWLEELQAKYKEVKGQKPRKDFADNTQRLITQILS